MQRYSMVGLDKGWYSSYPDDAGRWLKAEDVSKVANLKQFTLYRIEGMDGNGYYAHEDSDGDWIDYAEFIRMASE